MARIAIVTGSNRGIGADIVFELQKAGYRVVSNGRSARKGPGELHVRADVASPAGARKLIARTKKRFGGLDLLVCNVGDFAYTPVSDFKLEAWDAILTSNLKSAWYCCREALPPLRRSRGTIVAIGGPVTQVVRGNPRVAAYQMAKTALTVFVKSLAQAEAHRGVRVNMVNPGYVRTYAYTKAEIAEATRKVPAGRMGSGGEIGKAVVWLASDDAAYVNGAVVDVGGGLWV